MNFNTQAGGTPLESRQNPVIYLALLVAIIVIAIFGVVCLLLIFKKKQSENPEWVEKEKARATKYSDVLHLAKVYAINKDEIAMLWFICKKYEVQNIYYSIKHFDTLNSVFKKAYQNFRDENADDKEQKISCLFRLKFNLDKIFAESVNISSTAYLKKDAKMSIVLRDGRKIRCTVEETTKDFLAVSLPIDFFSIEGHPEALAKTAFTFLSPMGMPYAFVTRIIRYEKRGNKDVMILAHSSDLIKKVNRHFKRVNINETCSFSAVKTDVDENGKTHYTVQENKIDSMLQNISGGGCCISSSMPLREEQPISVELMFGEEKFSVIGKIIRTRKIAGNQNIFNVHIRFLKISLEVQNKILAKVYSYE